MKKKLQKISIFFLALPFLLTALACSPDEEDNTEDIPQVVEFTYKITIDKPVISSVKYIGSAGSFVTVDGPFTETYTWEKTINGELPFAADMQVGFEGEDGVPVEYLLEILVDGALASSSNGTFEGTATGDVQFEFAAHED